MTLRIWFQSTVEIASYHSYREALKEHFALVAPDLEVALHGVPDGTWGGLANSQVMQMPYAYHKILSDVLFQQLRRAEREGYDAFVLGSFTEPWLRELRSMTDMPVVSTAEAAVHVALSVAQKFALVTMNVENEWFQRVNMQARCLDGRISGIYVVRPEATEREIDTVFTDPTAYLGRFTDVARKAIGECADAIIPSEGLVATVVARNGLKEIDGVPVVDPIAAAILYAEMLAKLHRHTGLKPGRRWHYVKATEAVLAFVEGKSAAIS
jgi:Asp/Glu/hydantoin racemase